MDSQSMCIEEGQLITVNLVNYGSAITFLVYLWG